MDSSKYDVLKLKYQLCFPLYASAKEVVRRYRPYLDELNLTYTQYITMMVLWEERKLSVKALGEKLYLDSGTLTPVLKSLEAKGYVERSRSEQDERVLIVKITEDGDSLKEKAVNIPQKIASCVNLNAEEAIQLHSLLQKILQSNEQ